MCVCRGMRASGILSKYCAVLTCEMRPPKEVTFGGTFGYTRRIFVTLINRKTIGVASVTKTMNSPTEWYNPSITNVPCKVLNTSPTETAGTRLDWSLCQKPIMQDQVMSWLVRASLYSYGVGSGIKIDSCVCRLRGDFTENINCGE
jgi:hypothetical protein